MLGVSLFAGGWVGTNGAADPFHVDVIEGNDRNDAGFPSDLFIVLLDGEKGIDLYLQIQKLHLMITH